MSRVPEPRETRAAEPRCATDRIHEWLRIPNSPAPATQARRYPPPPPREPTGACAWRPAWRRRSRMRGGALLFAIRHPALVDQVGMNVIDVPLAQDVVEALHAGLRQNALQYNVLEGK